MDYSFTLSMETNVEVDATLGNEDIFSDNNKRYVFILLVLTFNK